MNIKPSDKVASKGAETPGGNWGSAMITHNPSESTVWIALREQPRLGDELETAIKNASGLDRQLVLCSVPPNVMGVFGRVGLQRLFVFADDKRAALEWLAQHACPRW